MQFKIKRKISKNIKRYSEDDLDYSYKFAKLLYKEIGDFIKAIILYQVTEEKIENKIKMMVIVDDISFEMSPEIIETYRIVTEKNIDRVDSRIKVTTIKLSSFWEYVKAGDPLVINVLRDGISLIDMGFFEPLQMLLESGRIKPTKESVWTYFYRAPETLKNSRYHVLQATIDLYWAASNISHAALMKTGIVPPSPEHLADYIDVYLVKKGLIKRKNADIMRTLYKISKQIIHNEVNDLKGSEFDGFRKDCQEYVGELKEFVDRG